ncbi:MAG: cysteine hydrolase family protein [Cuniculiplasma sp.]
MKTERAFIGVDLVRDFINGKFGSENSIKVAEGSLEFLRRINSKEMIILTLDSHMENDPEFAIWGEHCLRGTEGAELYPGFDSLCAYHIHKRYYDAFYQSDLEGFLNASGVLELFIFGISTDICVLHTVAGAFFRYFKINVIEDLCASIRKEDHNRAMEQMKRLYGITVVNSWNLVN